MSVINISECQQRLNVWNNVFHGFDGEIILSNYHDLFIDICTHGWVKVNFKYHVVYNIPKKSTILCGFDLQYVRGGINCTEEHVEQIPIDRIIISTTRDNPSDHRFSLSVLLWGGKDQLNWDRDPGRRDGWICGYDFPSSPALLNLFNMMTYVGVSQKLIGDEFACGWWIERIGRDE